MAKFKPGQSGNPAGRPKGSLNKQLQELRDASEKILPLVVERAISGDIEAQKLILDRALPRVKSQNPIESFALSDGGLFEQVQTVLRQTAAGEISSTIAAEIIGMLAAAAKIEEIEQLRTELETLKQILERRKYHD